MRSLLGAEWGKSELAKPSEDRHQILKWYGSMCRFAQLQKRDERGAFNVVPSGAMLAWYRLAYDLYLIKHNSVLQRKIIDRLRHKDQFQGARFELCVTASMISAGFKIDYENESDNRRKHAEFLATHPSGLKIAVEAKSRHRKGILDYSSAVSTAEPQTKVAVEWMIRRALAKGPDLPFLIFIEVNLPFSEELLNGCPWFTEIAETARKVQLEWQPQKFPANAIFFCNDPTYHGPEDVIPTSSFWCYEVQIEDPRFPLPSIQTSMIAQSILKRAKFPNEFPS